MKKILICYLFVLSMNSFSQVIDPNLFQNWYLSSLQTGDNMTPLIVAEINPSITPQVFFHTYMQISGTSACNEFLWSFSQSASGFLQFTDGNVTLFDCSEPSLVSFEQNYSNLFSFGFFYQIYPVNGGLQLKASTLTFGESFFNNFPLNTAAFLNNNINVYPNPCKSNICVTDLKSKITKIEIYNYVGQICKTISHSFEDIDISNFSSGIYFIKIFDDNGIFTRKVLKQ